jgi:signal recognition particle GTPase
VIHDTAGRLAIDVDLMQELPRTARRARHTLVCDALMGPTPSGREAVEQLRSTADPTKLDGGCTRRRALP